MATNFTKVGNEMEINLDPNVHNGQFQPDVTTLSDGRFFLVFTDEFGFDYDNSNIVGQFVNADGSLSGGSIDIEVDDFEESGPAIAARADGGAVVVWNEEDEQVHFSTISSTGVVSSELAVLTGAFNPDLAGLADGRTLVVAETWTVITGYDIVYNFIDETGTGTTGQLTLDNSDGYQSDAAVATFGNNALVVYSDWNSGKTDIVARFYNGTSFATEVTLDDPAFDSPWVYTPTVAALADGRFIVAWHDQASTAIQARFVSANGTPLGPAFTIFEEGSNWSPAVAALPDGGFVVTWTNAGGIFPTGSDSGDNVVLGRRFDATGASAGDVLLVNSDHPDSDQARSAIAVNAVGQAFVVWENEPDVGGGLLSVRGQAFSTAIEVINGTAGADFIETYGFSETINGLDGNDNIRALGGNDVVDGGLGNDTILGGLGDDALTGGDGGDTLSGEDGNDSVDGRLGADLLFGGVGNDSMVGGDGADTINGDSGNDLINGNLDNDVLTGGAGVDTFVFNSAIKPKVSNVDTIADFSAADDTMHLDNAIFTKLKTEGALKSKWFEVGKKADDGNDFIVYNKKTGVITYDKNGDDKGGAVKFAVIQGSPDDINAANFLVI